jgi:hypothetical protein
MPTYVFHCPRGHQFELFRSIRDFAREAPCECGETGKLVVQRTIGYVQGECRYDSPIDGRPITSWAQRKDDLARAGCQEYDPEMRKDADRARRLSDERLERSMSETVEREIEKMPAVKRERLHNELAAGLSPEVERL